MTEPRHVVIPVRDLVIKLRSELEPYQIAPGSFQEIVTQCLDVYMDWRGDDEQIFHLPYFNRIEVPAMRQDDTRGVRECIEHAVQTFAREVYQRLMQHGFFPRNHARCNMDYAFERFVGQDVALTRFEF